MQRPRIACESPLIQFLADGIDQLDLALDQLAAGDRNFDRFALMLVDNVVELTLHRFAEDKAGENAMWGGIGKPKHDPDAVAKALGQRFDSKVKLASKLGLVSAGVCQSLLYLHAFRNTAYHRGLRHEGILHSLALFYFRNACEVLKAYNPRVWSWSSSDMPSHRARKYVGNPQMGGHRERFVAAYDRLSEVAAAMKEGLVGDLSADMEATIETTDNLIQFLADDSPKRMTRDEAIVDAQVWQFAFTEDGKEFARTHGCVDTKVQAYVEWIARNYDWPVKSDPILGWRSRLASLAKENDYHRALKRYCDFMKQTEGIRATLGEAASQLDSFIDHQIDMARGK